MQFISYPTLAMMIVVLVACSLPRSQPTDPVVENPVVTIVPDRTSSADKFCVIVQDGDQDTLKVQLTNVGAITYGGGAELRVDYPGFTSPPPQILPVMPPPHVDSTGTFNKVFDFFFEIPQGCFNSDCNFNISWANQPKIRGVCLG